MKLLKTHKDILNELVKGKGYFKTPTVPKDHIDKKTILDFQNIKNVDITSSIDFISKMVQSMMLFLMENHVF